MPACGDLTQLSGKNEEGFRGQSAQHLHEGAISPPHPVGGAFLPLLFGHQGVDFLREGCFSHCPVFPSLTFPAHPVKALAIVGQETQCEGLGTDFRVGLWAFLPKENRHSSMGKQTQLLSLVRSFTSPVRAGKWGGGRSWLWLPGHHLCTEAQLEAGGWAQGTGGGVWPGWVLLRLIAGCQELEVEGSKEGRGGGPWCLLPSRGPRGISFLTQQRLSNPYPPPLRDQKLWEAGGTSDNECPWSGCPGPSDGKWEDPFSLPLSLW